MAAGSAQAMWCVAVASRVHARPASVASGCGTGGKSAVLGFLTTSVYVVLIDG